MTFFRSALLFLSISLLVQTHAQQFGVGSWKEHLPFSNSIGVAKVDGYFYAATQFGAYFYREEDESINRLGKVEGLSDFSISAIGSHTEENVVIIGYENGNLDLIRDENVINVNAIKIANLTGDKAIYNMHEHGDYIYIATGFGIVVYDVVRDEVKDTYIFGPNGDQIKTNDVTVFNDSIFAATDGAIYKASINEPFLADYNSWSVSNLPSYGLDIYRICANSSHIAYSIKNFDYNGDSLYIYDGNYNLVSKQINDDFWSIELRGQDFLVSKNLGVYQYDNSGTQVNSIFTYNDGSSVESSQTIYDGDSYWVADKKRGLNRVFGNWSSVYMSLPGPNSNDCFRVSASDDLVCVATGATDGSAWNNTYKSNGVYSFKEESWSYLSKENVPEMDTTALFDYIHVAIDPRDDNHIVASSFTGGILEFQNNELINWYKYDNSALQESLFGGNNQTKSTATAIDADKNIWVAQSYVNQPLVLIEPDGTSQAFNTGGNSSNKLASCIHYSEYWGLIFVGFRGQGILIYDFNETPNDPSDDTYKFIRAGEGNGGLSDDNINSITEDRDGEIWIGTDQGPSILYNPNAVLSNSQNSDAQQILLLQDGSYQYLLESQTITSIAIDGGNRKWIGTSAGGVFVMSPDGTEQEAAFSTSNSPILSNFVRDIAINQNSGEVFIATDKGLIGYLGEATGGAATLTDMYAYPNPVREDYNGQIAIRGLTEDADIKITDASGNLVISGTALGGQFVWNGRTLDGNKVATGVYYAFAVSQSGRSKGSTKILIIN